jgi:hypothetical protein
MALIRKIAVGPDYKSAMHFTVGQSVIDGNHSIKRITREGYNEWFVHVNNPNNETFVWKNFINMPVSAEMDIEYTKD